MNWLEKDALHSRFDPFTGELVTDDMSWGHLQVYWQPFNCFVRIGLCAIFGPSNPTFKPSTSGFDKKLIFIFKV